MREPKTPKAMIGCEIVVFPARAGTHFADGHRSEPLLGPREARTRGPV
jgi:hypothetical protein